MRKTRTAKAVAVAGVALAAAVGASAPVFAADTVRIDAPGASVPKSPLVAKILGSNGEAFYEQHARQTGQNWVGPTPPGNVVYWPAQAGAAWGTLQSPGLTGDQSIAVGLPMLNGAIMSAINAGDPVVVSGESEGTLLIEREIVTLDDSAAPPSPGRLSFYLFADPDEGVASLFPVGTRIPVLGYTVGQIPTDSPYSITLVYKQYDGWSNFPDRPWDLPADVNAVMGALLKVPGTSETLHTQAALSSPADAVQMSRTVNAKGGVTTTYMVPTQDLPILSPIKGVLPPKVYNGLNSALKPVVDAGYSQLTPNLGPHISHGRLVPTAHTPTARHATR